MAGTKKCFFCSGDCTDAAAEHVISEALGCKEVIPAGVCTGCNHRFGHSFDADFVNALALFRNFFKIPNAEGVVPGVAVKGKIGSEEFKFVITGEGKAEIPPHLLRSEKTATGQEKEFRIFQERHETKIEKSLRSRHGDLVWTRLEHRDVLQIIDVQASFEPQLLRSTEANRTIAKYALNLLVHEYGYPRGPTPPASEALAGTGGVGWKCSPMWEVSIP